MTDFLSRIPPATLAFAAIVLALMMSTAATLTALTLPEVDLPPGAVPVVVGGTELIDTDRLEEPDQLGDFVKMRAFFGRQTVLAAALAQPEVTITYALPDGTTETETFAPRPRTLADLPFPFWFQQGVGLLALLVGGWVLGFRQTDWGVRMFAVTALFLPVAALSASVYSTRPIAIDGDLFRVLSSLNHIGAIAFGFGLVGLFAMYPLQLVRATWLVVPLAIYGAGMVMDVLHVADIMWMNAIVASQMLIAIALAVVQWWRSRGEPLDRAGLRWFYLFSLIGCSLFVGLSMMPPALGLSETGLLPQAYAFGFFNLMHIGLALGVTRWRVFELDRYAYYVWLWLGGAALVLALDFALLTWLQAQPWASLALALLIGGFLYFPLRQMLMHRFFTLKSPSIAGRIPEILDVALAPTQRMHDEKWDGLLEDIFAPAAEIERPDIVLAHPRIAENGLALEIPGVDGLSPRRLRYAGQGRRLFNSADLDAVRMLVRMHEVVDESRQSYDRGVSTERDRISRDVHDNIGAQILSALHAPEKNRKDELLRDTLTDLRQIINDGFRASFPLAEIVADLRAEMADRLELSNIALDWPLDEADSLSGEVLSFGMTNTLRSVLRETTSNIIKHSGARNVSVRLDDRDGMIGLTVHDDGRGFDAAAVRRGAGLDNIAARVAAAGGSVRFAQEEGRMVLHAHMPLRRLDIEQAAQ
jgi:signal transduction histidine kinase